MLGVTHNDQTGKIGEMAFDLATARRNLFCAWPTIDKNGYDCILDNGKKLIKVQVKSSNNQQCKPSGAPFYSIKVGKGKDGRTEYTKDCYDVLAVYLHPIDTWYFFPFKAITNVSFKIYVNSNKSKWNKYRDNWDIFN